MEEELRDRWAADAGRGRAATTALDSLLGRYREPQRRYHGTAHVLRVLRSVEEILAATPDAVVPDPAVVRLAAWYHDAIYDPRPRRAPTRRPAPPWPSATWRRSGWRPSGWRPWPGWCW